MLSAINACMMSVIQFLLLKLCYFITSNNEWIDTPQAERLGRSRLSFAWFGLVL